MEEDSIWTRDEGYLIRISLGMWIARASKQWINLLVSEQLIYEIEHRCNDTLHRLANNTGLYLGDARTYVRQTDHEDQIIITLLSGTFGNCRQYTLDPTEVIQEWKNGKE